MFTCYVTPEEFYAGRHGIEHWIPEDSCEAVLRTSAMAVADDFRSRGIDISRLHTPVMLEGALYAYVTKSANYEGSSKPAGNASRLVIECTSADDTVTFYVEGSKDNSTWTRLRNVVDGLPMALELAGEGVYTARFFEKYAHYRLQVVASASVTFSAYLVDGAPDPLIAWKAIESSMFLVLDADTRTQELYDAAREQYDRLMSQLVTDYGYINDDGDVDIMTNARPQILAHR